MPPELPDEFFGRHTSDADTGLTAAMSLAPATSADAIALVVQGYRDRTFNPLVPE